MLRDGLKAYYKLDETSGDAIDSSGNGKTLTNTNSVSFGTGKINNGADFGTTSTNKVLTIAENLGITTGGISISCWVKMNAEIASGSQVFVRHQNNTNDVAYSVRYEVISSTKYVGFYRTKLGVADQAAYNAVALGTSNWYHLVLTYNGTNIVGYINGSALSPVAASGDGSGFQADGVNIGLWSGTTFPCKAIIDEVGIWDRALSADEVSELYNAGNGYQFDGYYDLKFGEYLGAGSATTKLLMHLNGNSADSSGNNNHGTDANMTYANGKFSKCGVFNGSNSRIQISDSDSLTLSQYFTISTWVNPTALPTSGALVSLVCKLDGNVGTAGGYDLRLYNQSGTQKIGLTVKAADNTDGGGDVAHTLPTSTWSLITAVSDGSYSNIYVNGQYINRVANTKIPGNNAKQLNIGNFGYYTPSAGELGRYFSGSMDEIIIENRAWSAAEVAKYYTYAKGRFGIV